MKRTARHRRLRAFTLIELLVVVSIIALLISILLPSLARAREQAKMVVCMNNQKQLAMANYYYSADYRGKLPHWDYWLWDRVIDFRDGTSKAPETGQLFGIVPRTTKGTQRQKLNYAGVAGIYRCPSDNGDRVTPPSGANWKPLRPATFSFTRNRYVMDMMVLTNRWTGTVNSDGNVVFIDDYLPIDRPKRASETPLLLEEHQYSALNDGYCFPFSTKDSGGSEADYLSMRHNNRAVLSYHDLHAGTVPSKAFNESGMWSDLQHQMLAPGLPKPGAMGTP